MKLIYLNCGEFCVQLGWSIISLYHSYIWVSYIFTYILHLLRVYFEFSKWPAPSWLDSWVGRALHQYRRGHGFESPSGLNLFRHKFHNCLSCVYLEWSIISLYHSPQFKHMSFICSIVFFTFYGCITNFQRALHRYRAGHCFEAPSLRWFLRKKRYRWNFLKLSLNVLYQALFRKIQ